jgi:type IX secretion system PorP/SprF family membrane protein
MRLINEHNADEWMFDFYEGNLNAGEQQQLEAFLESNPSFQSDFVAWKHSYIKREDKELAYIDQLYLGGAAGAAGWFKWGIGIFVGLLLVGGGVVAYNLSGDDANNDYALADLNKHFENGEMGVYSSGSEEKKTETAQYKTNNTAAAKRMSGSGFEGVGNENANETFANNFGKIHAGNNAHSTANTFSPNSTSKNNGLTSGNGLSGKDLNGNNGAGDRRYDTKVDPTANTVASKLIAASKDNNKGKVKKDPENLMAKAVLPKDVDTDIINAEVGKNLIGPDANDFGDNFVGLELTELSEFIANEGDVELERDIFDRAKETIRELEDNGVLDAKDLSGKLSSIRTIVRKWMDKKIGLVNNKDPETLIPGTTQLTMNPAFAGSNGISKMEFFYRNQWPETNQNLNTYRANFDTYIPGMHSGLGFTYSRDNFEDGMYTTNNFGVAFSPKIKVSRNFSIEPGVKFSYVQMNMDWNKVTWGESIEPRRGAVFNTYDSTYAVRATSLGYRDLGVGLLLNTRKFYIGFAVDHLLEPNENLYSDNFETEYDLPRLYTFQIGADYQKRSNSDLVISPQVVYQKQGDLSELWLGSSVKYKWLIAGAGVSSNADAKAMMGISGGNVKLTYSYDVTNPQLSLGLQPSHEVKLRFLLNQRIRKGMRY